MKQVKMMILDSCPHCKRALMMMEELKEENPAYANIAIEVIEEQKEEEKTKGYDYWYVPTFFVNEVKIHEGAPTRKGLEKVFSEALK